MKKNSDSYYPLPLEVTIGKSHIHGLGLMAVEFIKEDTTLGISHYKVKDDSFHNDLIRTPLGGFVNHSRTPNCKFVDNGNYRMLVTTKQIKPTEELTTDYTTTECGRNYVCNFEK